MGTVVDSFNGGNDDDDNHDHILFYCSKLQFPSKEIHMLTDYFVLLFQTAIREELSKMSFEELQKLKEQLGSKVYNEAMFGTSQTKETNFKRENKNR
jgi:hypothetical protein